MPSLTRKAGTESHTVKESRRYINLANAIQISRSPTTFNSAPKTNTKADHDGNLVRIVFNNEQYRSVDTTHAPVQSVETEAVILRAVQQAPRAALSTGRQVIAQLHRQTNKHFYKLFSIQQKQTPRKHLSPFFSDKRSRSVHLLKHCLRESRLMTRAVSQSRKWQLTGMNQRYPRTLSHPLTTLTNNWNCKAACRHATASVSHTRRSGSPSTIKNITRCEIKTVFT